MCPLIYKFLRSRIKQSSKTQGFTLTELIVVITILSILSVIGFSVMSHQSSVARDGKRISDIKTLSESARITSAQLRLLPTPIADSVSLTVSGTFIGYQGFMSLALVNPLGYGSDKIFDPKDNIPYTYRVNQHYDQAQFLAYLENPRFERTIEIAKQSLPSTLPSNLSDTLFASDSFFASDSLLVSKAYAFDTAYALDSSSIDLSKRYPYSAGDRLGIFLSKGSKQPLQNGVSGTGSRDISLSDASTLDIIVGSQGADEYVSTDISTGSLNALKSGTFDEKALLGMNSGTGSNGSSTGSNSGGGNNGGSSSGYILTMGEYSLGGNPVYGYIGPGLLGEFGPAITTVTAGDLTPKTIGGKNIDSLIILQGQQYLILEGGSNIPNVVISDGNQSANCTLAEAGGNIDLFVCESISIVGPYTPGEIRVLEIGTESASAPLDLAFMREPLDLSASCIVQGGKSFCFGENDGSKDIDGIVDIKQTNGLCLLKNNGDVVCKRISGESIEVQTARQQALQGAEYIEGNCAIKPGNIISCYESPSVSTSFQIPGGVYDLSEGRTSSLNHDFACALKNDGTVECWGDNSAGQTTVPSGVSNVRRIVSTPLGKTCALKNDGTVTCWGSNIGSSMSVPSPAPNEKFQRIDPYFGGLIAIRQNGSIATYIPSAISQFVPTYLQAEYTNAQAIAGMCAKYADNSISCGGTGPHELQNVSKVKPIYAVVGSVSSGITGTCYILTNGDVKCRGAQSDVVSNLHNKTNVRDIATLVSGSSTKWCLVKMDNTLECDSETTTTFDMTPNNVSSFSFLNISSGVPGWCMIDTNDTLNCKTGPYSWNISNVANVHKVVSNENQVCALMKDASSTCWNYASQSESHPFSAAKDIIANGSIICAHKNDNKVMCTGGNGYEPYYNTTASNIINGLGNVTGIYADMGTSQMCATTISGQIRCWNTSSAYSPASLDSGAPNVGEPIKKLMLDGYQFGCYLTYSGHVGCWGGSSSIVANIPSIMNSNIDNIFSADDDPNRTSTSIHILRDGHVGMWGSEYRSYNTSNLSSFVPESYYFLSNSSAFEYEGSTVTISITATNVPTDISIPYTINGIDANDITSGDLNGTVSLHNGLGEITLTLSEDQTTEGSEVMHINLNNGSAILDIEVYDSSINP